MAVLAAGVGCSTYEEPEPIVQAQPPAPAYIPLTIQKTLDAASTRTAQLTGAREQSPESLGNNARQGVGRTFEPVYFDAGSDELNGDARRRLAEYAAWFQRHPNIWAVLAGHTANGGSLRYNYSLGMSRAIAAQAFLRDQGLDERKFYPIGYGAEMPAQPGAGPAARAKNDRVEIQAFAAPAGAALPPPDAVASQAPSEDEATGPAPQEEVE